MDKKTEEKVKKKLKEGWIKAWMMIEVLAVTEDAARSSLERHVTNMEKEEKAIVYKKDFKEIRKVEKPARNIETAYSNVVEIELITDGLDKLVYIVMNYAPTAIEILEPEKLSINAGEMQGILTSIADIIHKFAAMGIGGVVIRT
jgi:hypothetical protein